MKKATVVQSSVIDKKESTGVRGRKTITAEIAAAGFEFAPGQYVMLRVECEALSWPEAYAVQEKTDRGFTVATNENDLLYHVKQGGCVCFWGALGTGVDTGTRFVLVAEAATYHLILPIALGARENCEGIIILGCAGDLGDLELFGVEHFYSVTPERAAALLDEKRIRSIAALNCENVMRVFADAPNEVRAAATVYVGSKKFCGTDACKGCYVHEKYTGNAINVCCQGPFFPLDKIDFQRDKNVFET